VAHDECPRYWHPTSLSGRRAIVTGAAQGVGRGITQALLERGASVLLVDRNAAVADLTERLAAEGYRAEHLVADLHLVAHEIARLVVAHAEPRGAVPGRTRKVVDAELVGLGFHQPIAHCEQLYKGLLNKGAAPPCKSPKLEEALIAIMPYSEFPKQKSQTLGLRLMRCWIPRKCRQARIL